VPPLTRVGCIVWIGYEPLFLARDLGFLDPRRLRLVEMPSNTSSLMLLATGDLEAATLTLDECLLAREGGVDLRVILVFDYSAGADVVMARPEIVRLKDLKGRRIGIEETAASGLVLAKLLEHARLAPLDVEKVALTSGRQIEAYRNNQVDALVSWEPFATQLETHGARRLFDSRAIPGLLVDVLVARTDALDAAPDNFRELVARHFQAQEHLHSVPDDALRHMAPRLRLSDADMRTALQGIRMLDRNANRDWLQGVNPSLKAAAAQLGQTMRTLDLLQRAPDVRDLADPRFLPGAR
jgi:NitT/TauT family transport system substrate-binding protein